MENSTVTIKEDNGWVAVIFDEDFDLSAHADALSDTRVVAFSAGSSLSSLSQLAQAIANDNFIPSAVCWYAGENSSAAISENIADMINEAGRQLSAALYNNNLTVKQTAKAANASNAAKSFLLRGIVDASQIEDMFPANDWKQDEQGSFIKSLHQLAAMFIKLDDLESAEACIDESQSFDEYHPRALALKAIVSSAHGETLGAVANMVSSLQQYEIKKDNAAKSSLAQSIEVINYKLKEGLEALNKRDNEQALSKFADAVFEFDTFYNEQGIDKLN